MLDVSRLHELGWKHRIELADGIRSTYEWCLAAEGIRGLEAAAR